MENKQFFIYLAIMVLSTYLIRAIPFVLVNKKITNPFINSFLYYIPYTVLTAMTFPTALYVTEHVISAVCGLVVAVIFSVKEKSLTFVALMASVSVLVCELLILFIN